MDSEAHNNAVDILIVGAGLAGLTTALKIQQKEPDLSVRILEASDSIGGQLAYSDLGEHGGKWIRADQSHMRDLLEQLNYNARTRSASQKSDLKRCWDIDEGYFASLVRLELNRLLQELELRMPEYKKMQHNFYEKSISIQSHIESRLFFTKSRDFMKNLVLLICGETADKITYTQFMCICGSCGGLKALMDIYLQGSNDLSEISSSDLLQALDEKLKNTEIIFQRKVLEVQQCRDYVEVRDSGLELHQASVVVLAVPWHCLSRMSFTPQLPAEVKLTAIERAQKNRLFLTSFIAQYKIGHWRKAGYTGSYLCTKPNYIIAHEYEPTSLRGYLLHRDSLDLTHIKTIVLQRLAESFGKETLVPLVYTQLSFERDSLAHAPLTSAWKRVIWSSSAVAATSHRGCLSGAVQSGYRAAVQALLILRPQRINYQDVVLAQDIKDIRRAQRSMLKLWLSNLNLYNASILAFLTVGGLLFLRHLTKD